jgi:3-methyladenine DNA glycosylase AlkD
MNVQDRVAQILAMYDAADPCPAAEALRALWLSFEPKSVDGIKAEQRAQQETVGIPVPDLKAIGKALGKPARERVESYLPLTQLLWDEYGREGRVVALIPLGQMEQTAPERIVPLLQELCRSCVTWEDADRLAMDALEPVVRAAPETWLERIEPWLGDENKWVRRAAVTVVGRLPMVRPAYTAHCLALIERLLLDPESEVKKAVSFAIRLAARGETAPARAFLARHVPPQDPAATWVLCDAVRSMAKKLLPEFAPLLPQYERWAAGSELGIQDRRSVESAIRTLQGAQS